MSRYNRRSQALFQLMDGCWLVKEYSRQTARAYRRQEREKNVDNFTRLCKSGTLVWEVHIALVAMQEPNLHESIPGVYTLLSGTPGFQAQFGGHVVYYGGISVS